MTENRRRRWHLVALPLIVLAVSGCSKGANRQAEKAEAAVEVFLDAWSQGESPEKFASNHPDIAASDPDWTAGYRLLSFLSVEMKPSPEAPTQFRCRVALTLRNLKGQSEDKEVVYEIVSEDKYLIRRGQR